MDFYGKKLATCSSDKTIRIFEIEKNSQRLVDSLNGYVPSWVFALIWSSRHEGPVWQVAWAHPKFGSILASCGYDGKVNIWKHSNGKWIVAKEWTGHSASGTVINDYWTFITMGSEWHLVGSSWIRLVVGLRLVRRQNQRIDIQRYTLIVVYSQ